MQFSYVQSLKPHTVIVDRYCYVSTKMFWLLGQYIILCGLYQRSVITKLNIDRSLSDYYRISHTCNRKSSSPQRTRLGNDDERRPNSETRLLTRKSSGTSVGCCRRPVRAGWHTNWRSSGWVQDGCNDDDEQTEIPESRCLRGCVVVVEDADDESTE